MKNLFLSIACCFLLALSSCTASFTLTGNCKDYTASGVTKTESRDVAAFKNIFIKAGADVIIHQGDTYSLSVTADENMLPYISTTTDNGGTLHIENEKCNCPGIVEVELTIPDLETMHISGSGNIVFPEDFNFNTFTVHISGSGVLNVKGTAQNMDVHVSGACDLKAADLKAENVGIHVSGSCKADVYADNKLDVTISGAGTVRYSGNAQDIHQNISGSGNISRK